MASVLEVRLSKQAVKVYRIILLRKCEAFNRGGFSTLPKHVNLSKDFEGTLASKTLKLSNFFEYSVQKKVSSLTGQPLSPRASNYLAQDSKRARHHQKYQQTVTYRHQRKSRRAAMERKYYKTVRNTCLEWLTATQHRSWKITIKSPLIDWQMIKF